jgi:glycosyltransferase involved in cell wall biosynthesis
MFFLLTRSEALGIVFAEAASYALPSVSYDTGGISAMVVDGETGRLAPEGSSAEVFADTLSGLMDDRETYLRMSNAALRRSEQTLNWPAWARDVRQRVAKAVGASAGRGATDVAAMKRSAAT